MEVKSRNQRFLRKVGKGRTHEVKVIVRRRVKSEARSKGGVQ